MGQMIRCPLIGTSCPKKIKILEKTFFLAEAEKPQEDRKRRIKAIKEAIVDGYKIRSALEEKGINAFTCKICEMIQACAYGIADISQKNSNVLLELGIMIALGKPTIILLKQEQTEELDLFSDLKAIEVIPFTEYLDIIDQLREVVEGLPPSVSPPSPIEDLEKIQPQFAEELKSMRADIVKAFKEGIAEAKLDKISFEGEKTELSAELNERLRKLEEKLEDMNRLGFATDANTASSKAYYFYNKGKYEEALACLNWAIELEPDDPSTLSNRGLIYRLLNNYDKSIADLNHSLELKPDDPIALLNRGNTFGELRKYDKSLADLNHSLELKPNHLDTLISRGVTYSKLKRYDEALADFNHSLEINPNSPYALYNFSCLFSLEGKTEDALAYLEKAIEKDKEYRDHAKTDEDFDNIRDNPRFKKLVGLD